MEDKKYIKISISTLLLIIAIIIIVVLSVAVCVLSNENKLIREENAALSNNTDSENLIEEDRYVLDSNISRNTELSYEKTKENDDSSEAVESDNQDSKGITLPQLKGEFYSIESIIKESRENQNIKNYKDFEFDLDNDGEIDEITLRHVVNEDEDIYSSDRDYHILEYNGESIYDHWFGMGTVGIVDLDNTDDLLEIWVYDDGPSDDPCYIFYRKDGNNIVEVGSFEVDLSFYVDGKGTVLAANRCMPWVTPSVFDSYYTIENNAFKKHNLDFSYNKNFEYTSKEFFFTTDLGNLEKFKEDNDGNYDLDMLIKKGEKYNIKKLDENTKFKIVEFVEKTSEYGSQDLKIELSDGTEGYWIHPYGVFYLYD